MGEETQRHAKPTRISEDTQVLVKLGSVIACAAALVLATVFVWQIKTNSEQALSEIRSMRAEFTPAAEKVQRLWWEYEQRTAGRGSSGQAGP